MINSALSRKNARFITYDIRNYYLAMPLEYPEYVKINLTNIPQDFIYEYNLHKCVHEGWVYFEIRNGVYSLPQSGSLANDLLDTRLLKHDYYQCPQNPCLWRHKWRPILFSLIVEYLVVEYVGKHIADHFLNDLKENYELTVNEPGYLYAGINLKQDYVKRTFRLTMDDYIENLRAKFDQPTHKKPQNSPHRHTPINYGEKVQYGAETPRSLPLNNAGNFCIQQLVGCINFRHC